MLYIEPLLIIPKTKYLNKWTHPEINTLTERLENDGSNRFDGNLVRAYFSFSNYRSVDIISIVDTACMELMLTEEGPTTFGSQLLLLLNQDIWTPGGEQFAKTEYGEIFNMVFPFYFDVFGGFYSNEVSINKENEDWFFMTDDVEIN